MIICREMLMKAVESIDHKYLNIHNIYSNNDNIYNQ